MNRRADMTCSSSGGTVSSAEGSPTKRKRSDSLLHLLPSSSFGLRSLVPRRRTLLLLTLTGLLLVVFFIVADTAQVGVEVDQENLELEPTNEQSLPPSTAIAQFTSVDESKMFSPILKKKDMVCAMCTDGLVYVHLGRAATKKEAALSSASQLYTIEEKLHFARDAEPIFTSKAGAVDEVVLRCLAQLMALGQLDAAPTVTAAKVEGKTKLTASVIVDFDSATPQTSLGVGGQCPAFLTEVRPGGRRDNAKQLVAYPRLPSWPLPPLPSGAAPTESTDLPLYFGTVAVRETDVDKDVRPPLSVALTEDRGAVVIRFGEDETSTRPEPFEMRCPAHFMSVFIGRFGRQHNQVQEMVHTLALTHRTNRTFIVPVLVPDVRALYIRIDAQKAYGFNALRREGGYCLLTYQEARSILKDLEANGETMTLRRFSFHSGARPGSRRDISRARRYDWSLLPNIRRGQQNGCLNIDGWLEDATARAPLVTAVTDTGPEGLLMCEAEREVTAEVLFPNHEEANMTRLTQMRVALAKMVDLLGGDHTVAVTGGTAQPRLAVLSGHMAFYVRPPIVEQTRLMGLLRPSEAITKDVDRFYAQTAPRMGWPIRLGKNETVSDEPGTLRPINFKHVIGFHVRHREGSCRREAMQLGGTAFALDDRFQVDQKDPSWFGPHSTTSNLALDCSLRRPRLADMYAQYTAWMRDNMSTAAMGQTKDAAAAKLVPTIYMAHDDQRGPIHEQVNSLLKSHRRKTNVRRRIWGSATDFPDEFVAIYDQRFNGSFRARMNVVNARLDKLQKTDPGAIKNDGERRKMLVDALYDEALTEILAMATDFFMLTNTGVFRGGMISSVTNNVVMRRWGRGLPCHGVLGGYAPTLYTGMWQAGQE